MLLCLCILSPFPYTNSYYEIAIAGKSIEKIWKWYGFGMDFAFSVMIDFIGPLTFNN